MTTVAKKEKQFVDLTVLTIEEKSVIVNVNGWRMRVSLDLTENELERLKTGRIVAVEYEGKLEDVHTLKLLPLKKI